MKRFFILILSMLGFSLILFAQEIPSDSLYLGQTPPGSTPKIFLLPVSAGSFAAERIAISTDNKEIYFTGIRNYYPTAGDTIKYFKYLESGWTGPINLFNNHLAPCLSINGDTLFMQNNIVPYQMLYSIRNGDNWTAPQRFLYGLNSAHYLQVTNSYNYYISSISNPTVGASDWCKININGIDTSALSLGTPVSTTGDNLDFYISPDETFIITTNPQPVGLTISYHKNDGSWSNPKSLGSVINFGLAMWGPYVSKDKKFLFYTTGTKMDYSDTHIYWVRIDSLIEKLKQTNFIPYLKNKIPNQTDSVGFEFNYSVPDTTFIDDDGNNTLTYSATLSNGNPLPAWLSFNSATRSFAGTPTTIGNHFIKVTATDSANASVSCIFTLKIQNPVTDINDDEQSLNDYKLFQNYPNPFNPNTSIKYAIGSTQFVQLKVYDVLGKEVTTLVDEYKPAGNYEVEFNATNLSSGVYFYVLRTSDFCSQMKMIALK